MTDDPHPTTHGTDISTGTGTEASTDTSIGGSPSSDQKRAVVLLSGGMDSATTAYEARARGYDLFVLHTSYGQQTETKEYDCAIRLADELDVREVLHIETDHLQRIGGSSLTDESIDVTDADLTSEAIPSSYVPFRNANLLSMAVSYAEARGCEAVFVGAHAEDYAGYPDCRPEFFEAFEVMVDVGTKPETTIEIEVPFVTDSKTDIARRGLELDVPFQYTWSCYREEAPACGTCDSCAYRLQAFQALGVEDPIPYAERPAYVD